MCVPSGASSRPCCPSAPGRERRPADARGEARRPMIAIVLAGGLGTRLRPVVPEGPKCMSFLVAGRSVPRALGRCPPRPRAAPARFRYWLRRSVHPRSLRHGSAVWRRGELQRRRRPLKRDGRCLGACRANGVRPARGTDPRRERRYLGGCRPARARGCARAPSRPRHNPGRSDEPGLGGGRA